MNFRDQFSGLFWLGVSIFVCVLSAQAGIGAFHAPGPGFLPFWSAVALGALAITLIIHALFRENVGGRIRDLWKGMEWHKVILLSASLIIYAILLPRLGYLVATFGLLTVLFGAVGRPRLWIQVVGALVTALITYVIFHVWLEVSLPSGILGF